MESNMEDGNARSCQEKLADTLVTKLGMDGAIQACRENQWEGVLNCLLRMQRGDGHGGEVVRNT